MDASAYHCHPRFWELIVPDSAPHEISVSIPSFCESAKRRAPVSEESLVLASTTTEYWSVAHVESRSIVPLPPPIEIGTAWYGIGSVCNDATWRRVASWSCRMFAIRWLSRAVVVVLPKRRNHTTVKIAKIAMITRSSTSVNQWIFDSL